MKDKEMNRQTERRKLFEFACSQMPHFETWVEEIEPSPRILTPDEATLMYEAGMLAVTDVVNYNATEARFVQHARLIPRKVRRSMARDLAKRRWEVR